MGRRETVWQPATTAPRDGTEFLMRFVGRRPYVTGVKWHNGCFVQLSDYCPVASAEANGWMRIPGDDFYQAASLAAAEKVKEEAARVCEKTRRALEENREVWAKRPEFTPDEQWIEDWESSACRGEEFANEIRAIDVKKLIGE